MKKVILICLLIVAISAEAQQLKPFPDSTGAWRIRYGCIQWPYVNHGSFRYFINGDTVANNIEYVKLYEGTNNVFDTITYKQLIGIFRVDSNRVFYKNISQHIQEFGFSDTSEVLLYNFNMQVGDSILNYNYGTDSCYLIVTLIDSVLINGEYLRQWHFSSTCISNIITQCTWIEGIGSKIGFFTYYLFFECYISLGCFYQNGQDFIVNLSVNETCNNLNVDENESSYFMKIFPNPIYNVAEISFNQNYQSVELEVYNMHGQLVSQDRYYNCNQIEFNRGKLNNGLYFMKFILDEKVMNVQKVIIGG